MITFKLNDKKEKDRIFNGHRLDVRKTHRPGTQRI
jgi:hypothetical protein